MSTPEKSVGESGSVAEPEKMPIEGYIKYTLFGPRRSLEGMDQRAIDSMLMAGAQVVNGSNHLPTDTLLDDVELVVTKYLEQ